MFFRQLLARDATLSYFFGCGSCHVGVAVDPVLGDEQWFIDEAARQDVRITHVIDTHVHADHFSGGRALAEKTGAKYCLHEANAGRVQYGFEPCGTASASRSAMSTLMCCIRPAIPRTRSACW